MVAIDPPWINGAESRVVGYALHPWISGNDVITGHSDNMANWEDVGPYKKAWELYPTLLIRIKEGFFEPRILDKPDTKLKNQIRGR